MRLIILVLACASILSAALGTCPSPLTGYEQVVPIDIPASEVPGSTSGQPIIFSTALQGTDDTIEDYLAAMSGANPEYRLTITDTAGTEIPFAQIEIDNDTSAVWTAGWQMSLDATDGGRVCVHIDTNESLSADASDCTSSGAFAGWSLVYIGGSTVNWANCGSNALTGTNSPTAGTGGPFHGGWTYNGTNNYHTAGATGSGDEFEHNIYGALVVLESTLATDYDTSIRNALGRQPYSSAGGPSVNWTGSATTRNEWYPPFGAIGGTFNSVAANTIAVIGVTQDSSAEGAANVSISWRNGVGAAYTWNFAPTATNVTDDFHFGQRGIDSSYWPGTIYAFLFKPAIYDEDFFTTFVNMSESTTAADDFFEVGSAPTYTNPDAMPVVSIKWVTIDSSPPANSSGLCQGSETSLGSGCASYEYGLDVLLGSGR